NQHLMAGTLGTDVTKPLEQWGQKASTNVLTDMKKSGINKAWIGLPNWANGLMNPKMVAEANDKGYLVGPYDSYQSIQEDASIDWNTASF
ncbi:glycoside hydrolase, partial [Agathobacter rectalis]